MDTKIINNGFSNVVQSELFFTIVVDTHCSVYMRHGSPARADWFKSCVPICRVTLIDEARGMLDTLAGVVDAWKSFPQVCLTRDGGRVVEMQKIHCGEKV